MSSSRRFVALKVRVDYYVSKIRVVGIGWTLRWIVGRLATEVTWVLLLPITVIAHLAGYRRVTVKLDRIGHLASELDCFLKERALGRLPNKRWFVVAPPHKVANPCLLDYWRDHVAVVQSPWICAVLGAMGRHGLMEFDVGHYTPALTGTAEYYSVLAEWDDRPPLLVLDGEHRERGWNALGTMGIPRDAWFVGIHAREPGFSAADESAHAHRNSDIRRLIPAIQEIGRRGGWVIRMGDPTMQPLPPLKGVVDYAGHPSKCDWMDVFLCAEARFFVGNTSGLHLLATAFGTPCALANVIPSSHLAFAPTDVSIVKLIWSIRRNRHLTFNEIFDQAIADYRFADLFTRDGLRVDENAEDDLCGLVVEMLDRADGSYDETPEDDALQQRFFSLFRPGHFGYGVAGRIGSAFLRRHRELLES
ncbi:MAG: TIGR04372 family glycosyltransferase [Vicinamibacterales bacterium]|nr:TIGR04372 family glycosyltransferase [Vicinamibacterales bacterium]